MSLSNTQYESIMRGYQRRQLANHQLMIERREAVFAKIPSFPSVTPLDQPNAVNVPTTASDDERLSEDGQSSGNFERPTSVGRLSVAYSHMLLRGESVNMKEYRDKVRKLTLQKEQLLLDHGFTKDYLDPIYDCELCRDSGFLASGDKCTCFLRQERSFLYQQSNLNESLTQDNFSTLSYAFHQGEDLASYRKAVLASLEFAQSFPSTTRNLLFYGKVGTGKSFLSGCIAADVMEKGYGVLYFSSAYLFETLAHYTFDGKDKENSAHFFNNLCECDLLIIDDLGTELTNSFVNSRLFSCLNERTLHKKATIISTNLELKELQALYSERIFSRISSYFEFYKLTGPDIRMMKKQQANRK